MIWGCRAKKDLCKLQDIELAIKGKFDAVLDTIGVPETERIGVNFLKRGGYYMTLQVGYRLFSICFHQ